MRIADMRNRQINLLGGSEVWDKEVLPSFTSSFRARNGPNWNLGSVQRLSLAVWSSGHESSFYWRKENPSRPSRGGWDWLAGSSTNGWTGISDRVWRGCTTSLGEAGSLFFPPDVAIHLVRLACERPDDRDRSLSQWDSAELAKKLIDDGVVVFISPSTVWRILAHHKLKPWRTHYWLNPKSPRDAEFYTRVREVIDLYTRPLLSHERVLSVDEKTSLQPRSRLAPTRPAQPGLVPNYVEHEYQRKGALQLFAAFDTRTGKVYGQCYDRKRQKEFIAFLEYLDREIPGSITVIHLILDNVSTHHGKQVQTWLKDHPRFQLHFTPVHCSWMNQVEQWFGILQRKRFRIADFASKDDLRAKIEQFISEWNRKAHPFNWSTKSVAKIMAGCSERQAA
jgi:transposase